MPAALGLDNALNSSTVLTYNQRVRPRRTAAAAESVLTARLTCISAELTS